MLKEARTFRLKDLNPSEKRIINELREGPKSVNEMKEAFGVSYNAVKRPLESLVSKGFVEMDEKESAFSKSAVWTIKRLPTDGIEMEIRSRGELKTISFNTYLRELARAIGRGELPRIAEAWPDHPQSVAFLGTYAAKEVEEPGSVTELQLLEIRSRLHKYAEILKEEHARVSQLLGNESVWTPKPLAEGMLKKTDLPLTPDEVREYARLIVSHFIPQMSQSDNDEEEMELDEDDE